MTDQLERVFRALLEDPTARRYGYDLMKAAGVASGTLYPLLARLEREGVVISSWETPGTAGDVSRPRKYFELTGEGVLVARRDLAALYAKRRREPSRQAKPVLRTDI